MQTILITGLLILASIHKKYDYMSYQWAMGLGLTAIPIGIYFAKRMGILFSVLVSYVIINASSIAFYHYGKTAATPTEVHFGASIAAIDTGLTAALLFLAIYSLTWPQLFSLKKAIPIYTCLSALGVIYYRYLGIGRLIGGHGITGPIGLDYSGMQGVLFAMATPFLIPNRNESIAARLFKVLGLIITFFGIVFSKSVIPYGVMAVSFGVYFFKDLKKWLWLPIGILSTCWFLLGDRMFQSSDRFWAYQIFTTELIEKGWFFLGSGLGTFRVFGEEIQKATGFMVFPDGRAYWWRWEHCEFLQVAFELGLCGLAIALACYSRGLYRVWKRGDREFLTFGVTVLSACLFDYPLRYFSTALCVTYFLVYSLRRDFPGNPTKSL